MKIIGNFDNKKVTFHNYLAGSCVQWICLLLANEIANFAFTKITYNEFIQFI